MDRTGSAGLLGRETVCVCYVGWREGGEEIPREIHADSDFAAVGLRDDCVEDPEEDEGCEADVEAWKAFVRIWPDTTRQCASAGSVAGLEDSASVLGERF